MLYWVSGKTVQGTARIDFVMNRMTTRVFAALLIVLSMGLGARAELQAGAAKVSIVPPFPTFMGGFGDRMDFFEGVHDEVYARALALDNGETQLIVIGSGLMAIREGMVARAKEIIHEKTGVPLSNILLSCVHNHSAPSYYQFKNEDDKQKPERFFAERFARAGIEAFESMRPAELGYRNGEIHGATHNRQQGNPTSIDPQVGVLRVEEKEGRAMIATLFNFTGHPVILGSGNLRLSGEYPGAACRAVEQVLGGVAIMTQGACGDITVHRSGDPFLEIQRLGRLVAGEVIKTSEFIRPTDENIALGAAYEEIGFEPRMLPSVEDAQEQLDIEKALMAKAEAAGAGREVLRAHERRMRMLSAHLGQAKRLRDGTLERPDEYVASVQVMQIGDVVLVGIPGELFVDYALEMRQRVAQSLGKSLCLVGYANGYVGYIVTPRAMETGGYEASVARINASAGRVMTERAVALAGKIAR